MSRSRDRLDMLAALRPHTTVQDAWPVSERDEALDRVLIRAHTTSDSVYAGTAVHRRTMPRRRMMFATAMTAVAATAATAVAMSLADSEQAYVATPEMLRFTPVAGQQDVRGVLEDLARAADARPAPVGKGRYHYIHSKGWFLRASADGDNQVSSSGITEVDRQLWLTSDGSGRLVRDAPHDTGAVLTPDMPLAPGYFDGKFLPADAAVAAVQGKYGHPSTAAGWAQTVSELWGRQVVPPQLQARLIRVLAAQTGVVLRGATVDRVGRSGIAVSAETERGPQEQIILVFQPETGDLLDAEHVILQHTELPVQPPATISYSVMLETGYTEGISTKP